MTLKGDLPKDPSVMMWDWNELPMEILYLQLTHVCRYTFEREPCRKWWMASLVPTVISSVLERILYIWSRESRRLIGIYGKSHLGNFRYWKWNEIIPDRVSSFTLTNWRSEDKTIICGGSISADILRLRLLSGTCPLFRKEGEMSNKYSLDVNSCSEEKILQRTTNYSLNFDNLYVIDSLLLLSVFFHSEVFQTRMWNIVVHFVYYCKLSFGFHHCRVLFSNY